MLVVNVALDHVLTQTAQQRQMIIRKLSLSGFFSVVE